MTLFLKNKKRRTVAIILALLLAAFFCFLKVDQNYFKVLAPERTESDRQNLDKELDNKDDKKDEQFFGRLEVSGDSNKSADKTNSENKTADANITKELPRRLEIPKLGVNARVQYVGLNSNGEMGAPSNGDDVAWFNLGTKPGEVGSAVIAGHLDDKNGHPAVFWNIHKLKVGDDVYIIDGNGNKKHFRVISLEKYKTGAAPMKKIFGSNDGIYLNLITCGGVWDKTKNNYTERLVVFTKYSPLD